MHKSGFVNIIGKPNVGKSTLMNAIIGQKMSIINKKPQTTRHRIIGIVSEDDYQIVFSDTPGFIDDPSYKMQESMNKYVRSSFEDADIILLVIEVGQNIPEDHDLLKKLIKVNIPIFLLINKIDLSDEEKVLEEIVLWQARLPFKEIFPISALHQRGTTAVLDHIIALLPEGPAYYPKDQLTDRPERFFVSEIIREKILSLYHQEIPYSTEVIVESFKVGKAKKGPIIRIEATIYVSRKTQKAIIIGKEGKAIKKLGMLSRKDLEEFLESNVHLELYVKVRDNWRNNEQSLKQFGYH